MKRRFPRQLNQCAPSVAILRKESPRRLKSAARRRRGIAHGELGRLSAVLFVGIQMAFFGLGCASAPPPHTGFISDYTKLQKIDEGKMRYISPQLRNYSAYMVDPVQFRTVRDNISAEQRAEVARYMHETLAKVLTTAGFRVVTQPGVNVARVRVAITDIQDAKWYLNVHPATKLTGAGRAGASMEAEVIDSVTGAQLAAAIRHDKGKGFELNPFSTLDDVKSVIDQWAESAAARLKELKNGA